MKRLPLLVAFVDRDAISPVDGKGGVVVGLTASTTTQWASNNTVTEAHHGVIIGGPTSSETGIVCNPLDVNDAKASGSGKHSDTKTAKDNAGVGEWVLGPGLTDDGTETNKSSGKTFSILPGGGILNTIR